MSVNLSITYNNTLINSTKEFVENLVERYTEIFKRSKIETNENLLNVRVGGIVLNAASFAVYHYFPALKIGCIVASIFLEFIISPYTLEGAKRVFNKVTEDSKVYNCIKHSAIAIYCIATHQYDRKDDSELLIMAFIGAPICIGFTVYAAGAYPAYKVTALIFAGAFSFVGSCAGIEYLNRKFNWWQNKT
ncbi:MAG: hypothetical protein WC222_00410 [Parachlamydiales bacterium]